LSKLFFKINGSRVNCDNRDRDNQKTKNIFLLSQNYVKWVPDVGFTLFKALNSLETLETKESNVKFEITTSKRFCFVLKINLAA